MSKNGILIFIFIISILMVLGCTSSKTPAGEAIATEPDIYEDVPQIEQQAVIEEGNEQQVEQVIQIKTEEEFYNKTIIDEKPKIEGFKFSPTSIVSTQHNISLSLDKVKHEIKDEYWGKITGITLTVLNNGSSVFKPKVLVLLYDEEDFKEEWLKPKAEIGFDVEKLGFGEHFVRDAIVNIAFDDIGLTKHFKLVLVDYADPANKPIVVVEKEFSPLFG